VAACTSQSKFSSFKSIAALPKRRDRYQRALSFGKVIPFTRFILICARPGSGEEVRLYQRAGEDGLSDEPDIAA
jgi:hypothetical protein